LDGTNGGCDGGGTKRLWEVNCLNGISCHALLSGQFQSAKFKIQIFCSASQAHYPRW
jgi:hypothetical protein